MAVLFVSHASRDDAAIRDLEAWLEAKGFTDRFVDHSGIDAGEKWRQALRDAAGACRVVLLFVTEAWLNSDECFAEFKAAWYMGKRLLPLFALDGPTSQPKRLAEVRAEDQGIDIAKCLTAGKLNLASEPIAEGKLESGLRAAGALAKIGLDPEAFKINPNLRPTPFPGLASFGDEDADAALFYGRGREIALTLDELREMRAGGNFRPYVILGASGSGKSSLLKAGVIPRLRREAPAWLPLRAFRPGDDPLRNFADALARTLADHGQTKAPGRLRDRLFDAWTRAGAPTGKLSVESGAPLQAELDEIGAWLRKAADRPGATILVSVDQAEELGRAEGAQGDALAAYLRAAAAATATRWRIALTIPVDSWPEWRKHPRFEDWDARLRDLPNVKGHRFADIVEEPARRYGVRVDSDLVEALMKGASGDDALPLLAYGLERLWRDYHASGELTFAHYERVGGLGGLIDRAAERALQALPPASEAAPMAPSASRLALAAATFVPALAQVNEKGEALRRIADWASFSEEQQGLLRDFDAWRLVVRKGDPGTVEVAHEALFREWKRLVGWLEPERARLEALRSLQVDALTWDRNGRDAGFLNHRGKRLANASALGAIEDYAKRLGKNEAAYLARCRAAEFSERRRERRVRAALAALFVGVIVFLLGWINHAFVESKYDRVVYGWPYWWNHFYGHALTAEAERALKRGDHIHECDTGCLEMIVVPTGEFMMGSRDGTDGPAEIGRYAGEGPRHRVVFAKSLAVAENDVTVAEWQACVNAGGCEKILDMPVFGDGNKPAINVTFWQARGYAAWMSAMTGNSYRLLSEAEWEYSARGGTQTAYFWGDEMTKDPVRANCNSCGNQWDGQQTSPVGSFAANAFGLFDMAGNVWQWVDDCWHDSYRASDGGIGPSDGSSWNTPSDCSRRMVRGGSWSNSPDTLRSAVRYWGAPEERDNNLGFRLARTLTP